MFVGVMNQQFCLDSLPKQANQLIVTFNLINKLKLVGYEASDSWSLPHFPLISSDGSLEDSHGRNF